ncbi:MAG: HAMP domain-containing histidine kinase [Cyanobacteria bacterium SIG31]|nr:HAMP domain-containing histidine kinase [Cyanobacteria bacterium SIG31]
MLLNILDSICEEYINIFMFGLNIFILLLLVSLLIFVRDSKKRWNKMNDYLGDVTKTVNSVRYGDLTKKINELDIPDSKDLTESLNRMIETLKDREIMINEFQKDLLKQNRILEQVLNSLSDGLMIVDENYIIQRATKRVAKWFDSEGKSLPGHSLHDYVEIPRKKPVHLLNNDDVSVPTKRDLNFCISSVELNIDDDREKFLVILKDVTAQKELETLKDDFVATLTHDLKVPIIAETNMLELLLDGSFGDVGDKQKVALKNMQTSNKELLDLVQVVLDTYKIRDGRITLYKENIMLESFIEEIFSEMKPIANKTKNELVFIRERNIWVYADRFQLKRVIKNLIQNAISYGKPKTPIEVTIGEIPEFVTIKIKDYGAGISREELDKIFNRYYSAAKKFRKIGTGLGLYLALQISKAHNGDLTVDSKEGEYTEFCIKIPVNYERNSILY